MLLANLRKAVLFWNPDAVFKDNEMSNFLDSETMPCTNVERFLASLDGGDIKRWLPMPTKSGRSSKMILKLSTTKNRLLPTVNVWCISLAIL